jgi:hypothetical protein
MKCKICKIAEKIEKEEEKIFIKQIQKILKKTKKEELEEIEEGIKLFGYRGLRFKIKLSYLSEPELYLQIEYEKDILLDYIPLILLINTTQKSFYYDEDGDLVMYLYPEEVCKMLKLKRKFKNIIQLKVDTKIYQILDFFNEKDEVVKIDITRACAENSYSYFIDSSVLYVYINNLCFRIVMENEIEDEAIRQIQLILASEE